MSSSAVAMKNGSIVAGIQTIPPVMPRMGAVLGKAEIRDLVPFLTSLKE
jgi:hypothetical protein